MKKSANKIPSGASDLALLNSSGAKAGVQGGGAGYMKAQPLAMQIGLCPRTLFRWAAAGHITMYKVNARVCLFRPREVLAYIATARMGSSAAIGRSNQEDAS